MNNDNIVAVHVTAVRPATAPTDTVRVVVGMLHGMPVTFAAEPRMAYDLQRGLTAGQTVVAMIEQWQLLGSSN
jgi:hypothetical protein